MLCTCQNSFAYKGYYFKFILHGALSMMWDVDKLDSCRYDIVLSGFDESDGCVPDALSSIKHEVHKSA